MFSKGEILKEEPKRIETGWKRKKLFFADATKGTNGKRFIVNLLLKLLKCSAL